MKASLSKFMASLCAFARGIGGSQLIGPLEYMYESKGSGTRGTLGIRVPENGTGSLIAQGKSVGKAFPTV
jgi:hypothetical protein